MNHLRYTAAHADIVFEQFEGDMVVLDLRSGVYFDFNPTAASMWTALIAGASEAVFEAAGLSAARIEAFMARVVECGLVTPVPDQVALGPDDVVTRTLADALVAAGDCDPVIGNYDDLADLFQADPIHEVDVQHGWPHRPADA
jgi:hypothetical protein